MNLHSIVSSAINVVNPFELANIQVSNGYTTGVGGKRIPSYDPMIVGVAVQIQALGYKDLQQIEGLNLQGIRRKIYLNGRINGLVREANKGGDLIYTRDGNIWLVVLVTEYWADWTSVIVTLQNGR